MLRVALTALALTIATVPCVTALRSGSCTFLISPPSYTFIGGGFHMELAIEYPLPSKHIVFRFDLPKSFFIDEAETKQLYRMEVLSANRMTQGTAAVVLEDITRAYTPLHVSSQHTFDIEAPVFKVNYTTNQVKLTFEQMENDGAGSALNAYLSEGGMKTHASFRARLVIPIHSRYDTLDTTTPFSLLRFLTGEDAYVHRCLPKVDMTINADPRCGSGTYNSNATPVTAAMDQKYKPCLDLPVGQLGNLPFVYHALMGLLVSGAVIVILVIR